MLNSSSWLTIVLKVFLAIVKRDLLLALRTPTDIVVSMVFFIIVLTLFPLALNLPSEDLPTLGAGLVWVSALLASILSLGRLFETDYHDGSLDELLASGQVYMCVFGKILSHWLVAGLPLVLLSLAAGIAYQLNSESITIMVISLILGTPILSLIGAIGASLTVGLRNAGSLLALLVLPLNVPVLIYGTAAIRDSIENGENVASYLLFLAAMLIVALVFAPLIAAAGLKISND